MILIGKNINMDGIFLFSKQEDNKIKFCSEIDKFVSGDRDVYRWFCNNPVNGIEILIWDWKVKIESVSLY